LFEIKLPSKQEVNEYTLKIEAGTELDYDNFIEYLNLYNYQRENFTEVIGTFSVRGSIIDFWSFSEKNPGRIEFNGDLVESIRYFDAESQRSLGTIKQITLAPNVAETTKKPQVSIFEYLNLPLIITSENIFDLSESENQSNLNHDLIIDEDLKEDLFGENTSIEKVEIQNNELHQIEDFFAFKSKWLIEKGILAKENVVKLKIRQTPVFNSNYKMISQFLIDQTREKFKILITSENELQRKRLEDLFSELDPQIKREIDNGIIKIIVLPIKNGFILEQDNLILLSDYKIFGKPYRTKITQKQKPKKSQTKDFSSLKRGDFVVHETFGIGEYQGLEKIKIGNV
jgi:transcription-repair coupling factor (superfamily II helicase)